MTLHSRQTLFQSAGLATVLLPVGLFSLLLLRQLANLPLWDDYPAVLAFACDWQATSDWQSRGAMIFEQYFSHRIVLTRLCVLATMAITGEVNFLALQLFGWAAWIGVFALLAFRWRAESRSWWLLVPVACVLMQPQSFSNHLIGMQSVQNLGVVLWAFLALDLAGRSHPAAFPIAVSLAGTAPFVSANGLLVAPAMALLFFSTGQWRRLPLLLIVGGLAWLVYFTGYANPQASFKPGEFVANAAMMAGAPAVLLSLGKSTAFPVGLLLLGLAFVLLARPDTWRTTPVAAAGLAFVVLTILMAARGRIGWGPEYMLHDRYRIYGMLLIVLLYWQLTRLVAPQFPRCFAIICLPLTALFCLLSYASFWPLALNDMANARGTAINRQLGHWYPASADDDWIPSVKVLQRAETAGIYRLPALLPPTTIAWLKTPPTSPAPGIVSVRAIPQASKLIITPGAGQPRPDFGLLIGDVPVAVPLVLTRPRLVDLLRHGRFTGFAYDFLLAAPSAPAAPDRFIAVGLKGSGHPHVLWEANGL